jgi:hypothetical protein
MYYLMEYNSGTNWLCTGIILNGEYRKHVDALEVMRKTYPGSDFRARHITEHEVEVLAKNGMTIMTAPEVVNKHGQVS